MSLPLTRDLILSRSLQLNCLSKMNRTRSEPMRVAVIITIISQKSPDTDSFSLNIMKRNTCKTYVITRKCWQWWWTKWTIVEFQLLLHTLNVLLLFSSFDSTVNNMCLGYQPNFTNIFQLHGYDYVIRFMHIKRSIMMILVRFQQMTTPLSIINIHFFFYH